MHCIGGGREWLVEVEVEVKVKMKEWGEVEKRGQGVSVEPSSY